jgi:flavin-dependent dehydrogenase
MKRVAGRNSTGDHPAVAIVGAGPAGCAAACGLHACGVRIVMFEKGARHKDKPCGDAYLPGAIESLAHLGIGRRRIAALGGHPFESIDLFANDKPIWRWSLDNAPGYVVNRSRADQALRDEISRYAEIRYGSAVRGLRQAAHGGWLIQVGQCTEVQELYFDAVILATGSASKLPGKFAVDGDTSAAFSMTTYVDELTVDHPRFQFTPSIHPGYTWAFPAGPNRMNMGVCALCAHMTHALKPALSEYMAMQGMDAGCGLRAGRGNTWSGKGRRWHLATGLVSCGDAAGLVDPLTGEGISAALQSGEKAGAAIAGFLNHGTARVLQEYSLWVGDYFGSKYAASAARRTWSELCGMGGQTL